MFQRSLPLIPLLLLAACTSGQPWTALLTPDGVHLEQAVLKPQVEVEGVTIEPRDGEFVHWQGQTLFTGDPASFNGVALPIGSGRDAEGWTPVRDLCMGQDTVWGMQSNYGEQTRVVRLDGEAWIETGRVDPGLRLIPRLGQSPVLLDEESGRYVDLDGRLVGQIEEADPKDRLFAGGVLMSVLGWEDTSEDGAPPVRQQRVVGPGCEALLAGQLVTYIPSAEGLETLSTQGVLLHRERVLPSCEVVHLEEIYHPEKNFWAQRSVQAGDHGWGYWSGF